MKGPPPAAFPRRSDGFTLVELMVVLVLIGILTAVILPEMRGTYGDAVLRGSGRELADVCALASSRAVGFNRPHRVSIDPATRRYRIERQVRGGGSAPDFAPVRGLAGGEGALDQRIVVRIRPAGEAAAAPGRAEAEAAEAPRAPDPGAAQSIAFYPDGTADRMDIVLEDRAGFGLRLRVNPITSRIRVQELGHP